MDAGSWAILATTRVSHCTATFFGSMGSEGRSLAPPAILEDPRSRPAGEQRGNIDAKHSATDLTGGHRIGSMGHEAKSRDRRQMLEEPPATDEMRRNDQMSVAALITTLAAQAPIDGEGQ